MSNGSGFMDKLPFDLAEANLDMDIAMATASNMMQVSNPSSAASSVPNTDEEEDETQDKIQAYKERRREAHTQAEKKRRDAIKKGYEELQTVVPSCNSQSDSVCSQKISKAVILQRTLSYIEFLQQQQKKQADEQAKLKKEKMALTIMKENYQRILKDQQSSLNRNEGIVTEQVKFKVFQEIMEKLFLTFNNTVSTADFQDLSHCVINWIEEQCKPQALRSATKDVLVKMKNQQLL